MACTPSPLGYVVGPSGLDGPPSDSLGPDVSVHQDRTKGTNKRPHHAQAGEDELDYGVEAKRYRAEVPLDDQQVCSNFI